MRCSLKTVLIAEAVAPPVLAWLWLTFGYLMVLPAIYALAVLLILDGNT